MGAQHSSSALLRAMSMILRGVPFVKVYCDDLLVFTKTRKEHIEALGIIFARIAKYGVKLAAAKCNLHNVEDVRRDECSLVYSRWWSGLCCRRRKLLVG